MNIFHLLYTSKETQKITYTQVFDILKISRIKNAAVDVTGILLFRSGYFLQLLEGEEQAVKTTFNRIKQNPLHTDIQILLEFHDESRIFPQWTMGYPEKAAESSVTAIFEMLENISQETTSAKEGVIKALRQFNQGAVR